MYTLNLWKDKKTWWKGVDADAVKESHLKLLLVHIQSLKKVLSWYYSCSQKEELDNTSYKIQIARNSHCHSHTIYLSGQSMLCTLHDNNFTWKPAGVSFSKGQWLKQKSGVKVPFLKYRWHTFSKPDIYLSGELKYCVHKKLFELRKTHNGNYLWELVGKYKLLSTYLVVLCQFAIPKDLEEL